MPNYMKDGSLLAAESPLAGGTWLLMGDSITQYMKDGGYIASLAEELGLSAFKSYALAGAQWESSSTPHTTGSSLGQLAALKADVTNGIYAPTIITLAFGSNGSSQGTFWEDEEDQTLNTDTTTMCGAMHTVLQDLIETFNVATVRIGGIIPPQAAYRNEFLHDQNGDYTYKARMDLIRSIYSFYSIPYLDMSNEGYIMASSICDNGTLGDTVHPSARGNQVYCRRLKGWLPTL